MPQLGVPELLIIAFIILVLFGSKKLPGAARSLGQSLRIFKAETSALRDDDTSGAGKPSTPALPRAAAVEDPVTVNGQPLPTDNATGDRATGYGPEAR